jgi:hypothetical protein
MPAWFGALRMALFALLAANTAWYFHAGSLSKGIDAAAWLLLLGLFSVETRFANGGPRVIPILRALRLAAALGVGAAGIAYVVERDALDAINTILWIGVVVLLECEVRYPHEVGRHRALVATLAGVLYGSLAALVAVWAWRSEWLDAYDALLWLVAFAALEIDALGVARTETAV